MPNDKKKFPYGPHTDQFGYLHTPETTSSSPVLVVIHGGYWKDNHTLESYATLALVNKFKNSGAAVWNLEYRRMNAEGANVNAPWPAVLEDVAAGIDFLRSIADSERLDLNRIAIVGHSAGAHLAVWAASRGSISENSDLYSPAPLLPSMVIAIAGILDLAEIGDLSQPDQVERLMGGTPDDVPDRFAAANPTQLSSGKIPITIVHGARDEDVPVTQAYQYLASSDNPNVNFVCIERAAHFGMLPLDSVEPADWPELVEIVANSLEHLGAHRPIDPALLPVNEIRPRSMGAISVVNLAAARRLSRDARAISPDPAPDVSTAKHTIDTAIGSVDVYVYQPESSHRKHALLWFHGGGYIMGTGDDLRGKQLAADAGCTVISVDYRLAPEHPYPAGVDDGIEAWHWVRNNAPTLGIDVDSIAIGGASAGAGLAAGLSLRLRDALEAPPIFQLLMYPMLDNRHDTMSGRISDYPIWSRATSLNAWDMYLNGGSNDPAPAYASPSRAADLSNLPSTYLCVGDVDLFRDENIAFMRKLIADGSPGEYDVYPGVYHAADLQYPEAEVSRRMYGGALRALRRGLGIH